MAGATYLLAEEIGNHLFRTASLTKPTAWWVGYLTTLHDDAGANGVEVSGGSYARVQCGPGDSSWTVTSSGPRNFANANDITFPAPTANWGTILGAGLFLASSGGTPRFVIPFTQSKIVGAGDDPPVIEAGALIIPISGV